MTLLLVICLLGGYLLGCASIPKELPETMRESCALYQEMKPQIVKARDYAAANWEKIPAEWKPTLEKLDRYLPKLDKAGKAVCAASGVTEALSGGVDWDDVLSTVVRAATIAAELKMKGAI